MRFYADDPDQGGCLIGEWIIPYIKPLEHGLAEIEWQVPPNMHKLQLYVVAAHNTGPSSAYQKIKVHKTIKLLR